MARDDWKYLDEEMEEWEEEERKSLSPEKQCEHCLHWVPMDAFSCAWCGKPFGDVRPE